MEKGVPKLSRYAGLSIRAFSSLEKTELYLTK